MWEKARFTGQAGIRKTSVAAVDVSKQVGWHQNRGRRIVPGRAWRMPVYRPGGARHAGDVSLVCGSCAEREESAGINRHEERDENARHRRSSDPRWPRVMRWRPARAQRSVDRGTCRPAMEPRNHCFGVPTSSHEAEGHIAGGVSASRPVDPARSENLCMYGVLMRENRKIPLLARPVDRWAGRPGNVEAVSLG